ncbi:Fic/DOC family protein [Nocardia suismassiliense]|uniref:Fic/DOC family protein n=1 Tax=Nocardia suismassiliense TaxID=2077092 RepID=UPI000D1F8F02|nr:Fic family protein [Nocardia suismassiliense]
MPDDDGLWVDPYFLPDTPQVLANRFGVRNADELLDLEYQATALRAIEIETGAVQLPETGDAYEWKAIHRHLFQDVYEWAGEFRTVWIGAEGDWFIDPPDLESYIAAVTDSIRGAGWAEMNRREFVQNAASTYQQLNWGHPFREGNGRSLRIFLDRLSSGAQFVLDYGRVSPGLWNSASAASHPPGYDGPFDVTPLIPVFADITVERVEPSTTIDIEGLAPGLTAAAASILRPPTLNYSPTPEEPEQLDSAEHELGQPNPGNDVVP